MKTFSSSPLLLGSIANAITGCGSSIARHLDRLVAVGEPVAGARLLELGDGADVAGAELVGAGAISLPSKTSSWPMRSLRVGARVRARGRRAASTPW